MAEANSIDEYIDNLKRKRRNEAITTFVACFPLSIFLSYYLVKNGLPRLTYSVVLIPLVFLVWELWRLAESVGNKTWNILCPKCDEYISLHHFECPPPCNKEYTERSIIEGCPACNTRYKKGGHDAFRYVVCDNCGNELYFSEPYDFKPWSMLAKGQTWETETILVNNATWFSDIWKILLIGGVGSSGFLLILSDTEARAALGIGLYFSALGVLFLLIHKVLYGDIKRIPNPTFKRREEPKEVYVYDDPLAWRIVLGVGVLGTMLSSIFVFGIVINTFFPLPDPKTADPVTYTPFGIAWRLVLFASSLALIIIHSRFSREYKKVPNPRYKEDE